MAIPALELPTAAYRVQMLDAGKVAASGTLVRLNRVDTLGHRTRAGRDAQHWMVNYRSRRSVNCDLNDERTNHRVVVSVPRVVKTSAPPSSRRDSCFTVGDTLGDATHIRKLPLRGVVCDGRVIARQQNIDPRSATDAHTEQRAERKVFQTAASNVFALSSAGAGDGTQRRLSKSHVRIPVVRSPTSRGQRPARFQDFPYLQNCADLSYHLRN